MPVYASLRKAWLRALERELADVLSADDVVRVFGRHFDDALAILRAVEGSSRAERQPAIEQLLALTDSDSPELHDVPVAAARCAVDAAAADLGWDDVAASSVERRAIAALNDLDERLAAVEATYVQGHTS